MNLVAFQKLRNGLTMNGRPASARTLSFFEKTLFRALAGSGVFAEVEVEASDDNDRLLVALCTFHPGLTEDDVAHAVEQAWGSLGYEYWEAHAFLTDRGHVEMQAGTLGGVGGEYVTVHLVAQSAALVAAVAAGPAVPAQVQREVARLVAV